MTTTYSITTDSNGRFYTSQTFQPPVPFSLNANLYVTLTLNGATSIDCSVLLSSQGNQPQSKTFTGPVGQKVSLGTWHIVKADSMLVVHGGTTPSLPNVTFSVVVEADFASF